MKKKEKVYKNIVKLNRLEYKNKDFIINSNIKKLLRMHRKFIEYRCGYYGMGTEDVISDFLLYCYNKLNKRNFDDLEGGFITNKIKFIVLDCFKRKHKKHTSVKNKDTGEYENLFVEIYSGDSEKSEFNLLENRGYELKKTYTTDLIKQYLPKEEFEILYDFYFLGMTNEEMGAKYGKPKTTIRDRRIRIQKKLREALLDDGYDLDDLLS